MDKKTLDFAVLIVLFLLMIIGTIIYSNKVENINNKKITIISDSEMDK